MLNLIIIILTIILSFILQTSVFTSIAFGGIIPNLLIIVTASFGFMQGKKIGLYTGLMCGILIDLFYGNAMGFYAILYMYIGYLNGLFKKIFYPDDIKLPLVLVIASDLILNFMCYILQFLLKGQFQFGYYLLNIIIPELIYTIIIACILYPLLLCINNRVNKKENRGVDKIV
ncbi:MAG: rod shape-determining protein MreD [Lachnospiraceae bacterium]